MTEDRRRIRTLDFLDAEDIKQRNTTFLNREDQKYDIQTHQTPSDLRRQIWNVRNGDLRKVIRQFPFEEPLIDQCALWMQAMVGKHFFPDANHRTAMQVLRKILKENGISPGSWPRERTLQVHDESHDLREELPPITLADIYERDPLYELWQAYFEDVLTDPSVEE